MRRWLAWKVLFPLHERAKGHPTLQILKEMEAADRLDSAEMERLQVARLRDFLNYGYSHVPYVRDRMKEAGLSPDQVRALRDLRRLPIMRKADVRRHRESLRSDIAGKLTPFATGGSTGEPLIFDLAKRRIASRVACRQRVSRWWGVSIGDPEIALWGAPAELTKQDRLRGIRDWFLATRLLSAFEMNASTISRYLDILEEQECRQIFGYPSAIYLLCLQAKKEGRDLRRRGIRAAFVTGEVLFPHQRELISQTLGCPVADGYGGRDSGFIAHECPQGGMHLLADAVVVEIVDADGLPVAPGEIGEIVVTDLYSHEFPFLRYATGDMAALSTRRCSCGRSLPMLERIEGRSNDTVTAPDGRIINSLALIYAVREVEGIEQFRIVQKRTDCFHVQLVKNENFPKNGEGHIQAAWIRLLRCPIDVTFESMSNIPPERLGKFRHIVSELPAERSAPEVDGDRSLSRVSNG